MNNEDPLGSKKQFIGALKELNTSASCSTDLLCDDIFFHEDLKSQVGIDGENKGVEYCKVYDEQWRDLIRLMQVRFLKKALEIVIKEPEYISSSQSTRQGYVRATNDMERALKNAFQVT